MARSRQTGEFAPLETVGSINDATWSDQVRRRVEESLDRAVAGSPATVRRALEQLAERTGADELMASTSTYDREALLASDGMLAPQERQAVSSVGGLTSTPSDWLAARRSDSWYLP